MRHGSPVLLALAAWGTLIAGAAAGATRAEAPADAVEELSADLAQILAEPGWPPEAWGVMVVSLDGGDTLFAHRPEAALAPASNMKLFTSAAALHYLGPGYRYSTYLAGTGPVRGGVLHGDLVIYGTGDPTLSARFHESKTAVWEALADSLAALGIERITGDVVGDASYFEGPGIAEGWDTTYITHSYAAPASALSTNDNVVTLHVRPGPEVGAPPEVNLIPGGRVPVQVEARTVASGRSSIEVERSSYDAPLVLTGQLRRGGSGLFRAVPVIDPARFSASVVAHVLEARGIRVDGDIRSVTEAAASPVGGRKVFAPAFDDRAPVQVLALHRSPPLQEILEVVNQRSHNLYAETVLRTVGRIATGHGSIQGGARAVEALLGEDSRAVAGVHIDDGSGLSKLNRASARSIVELLAFMDRSPYREHYLQSLPEAAVSRGLRRMQETAAAGNLRAKTGTIDRVSALSGYVRARNGERLAFSILSNGVPSTWRAKRIEDRIGARLASFDRPAPPTGLAREGATADRTPPAAAAGHGEAAARVSAEAEAAAREAESTASEAEAPAESRSYVVKRGDTLEGIARRHGVALSALRDANPGVDPRRLMPGRELRIPR